METIKGFKVFNPDWTCRGFQYKVGETFVHNGNIEMCGKGFHFCQKASDCFNYYDFNSNNKVAEVEAIGLVETQGDKSVTDKITIVREIEWQELLTIVNKGRDCAGLCNTGNRNTGGKNTGSRNTGNRNAGDRNTGDYNTGDWNKTDYNSGFFTNVNLPIFMFNKPTSYKSHSEIRCLRGVEVLNWNFENSWWIYSDNMTAEEKTAHPEHKTTGGYLKTVEFKTACKMMWNNLDKKDKKAVMELPNFDAQVFEDITGINVNN